VKKSRFTEEQIIAILRQHEAGVKVAELCRKHGVAEATFYNWKSKYGGLDVSQLRRLKELEAENSKLKKMYAELSLMHEAFKACARRAADESCLECHACISRQTAQIRGVNNCALADTLSSACPL
jgi:putative transposase